MTFLTSNVLESNFEKKGNNLVLSLHTTSILTQHCGNRKIKSSSMKSNLKGTLITLMKDCVSLQCSFEFFIIEFYRIYTESIKMIEHYFFLVILIMKINKK